ncbi:Pentatricopeptide repeat-containing protein [Thalictrum thalictroides]|uniref:Pentatricopeptide repeat-containing protein n=1 Tax=Thalictrum thalictroides TaxID=46969 RepID=A0A7J6UST0_THATH|nr:Pentatricopeptide repeat-containing protein [Thalictrum thalictroides]
MFPISFLRPGTLMDGLCKNERFAEAIELYDLLEKNGLKPDIVVYNIIINGLCKTGQLFEAKELLYSLSTKDLQPDTRTYNVMINGYCKEGMLHNAEALFHVMVEKSLVPDDFTFNILAQGFLVQGSDADKAMHFVNTMIEKGFSPNAETMSKLLNLQVPGGLNQERINMLLNFVHKA